MCMQGWISPDRTTSSRCVALKTEHRVAHVSLDDGTEGSGAVFDGTCTEIDECLDTVTPVCAVNQVCQNTIGSYTCYCKPQFVDDGAGNCVNRDECQEGVCPISGVSGM